MCQIKAWHGYDEGHQGAHYAKAIDSGLVLGALLSMKSSSDFFIVQTYDSTYGEQFSKFAL